MNLSLAFILMWLWRCVIIEAEEHSQTTLFVGEE